MILLFDLYKQSVTSFYRELEVNNQRFRHFQVLEPLAAMQIEEYV